MSEPKYEVRDPEAEKLIREIGTLLKDAMLPGYGFTLMIYTFGPGGHMLYASNAHRQDMIKAMREFIAKFEEN